MDLKHFSHAHPLTYHQTPPQATTETLICSGCNLHIQEGPTTSYYTCWQCQFFLHDQCFRATRALSHPSHASHPLCLVPYPTYPSGTFICNSCNLQGTGFSYSCPSCEFDLHIHCAHNNNNYNFVPEIHNPSIIPNNIYPPSQTHNYGDTNTPYQNNYSPDPTQFPNTQYPFMPGNATHNNNNPTLANNLPNDIYAPSQTQNFLGNNFPNQNIYPSSQAQYSNTHYLFNPENIPHQKIFANAPTTVNPAVVMGGGLVSPPQPQGVKHFSHEHPLDLIELQEKNVVCCGCEKEVSGLAYRCVDSGCKFNLHRECFGLPLELEHKSHTKHPLTLLTIPPYKEGFTCKACLKIGKSFTYHCPTCKFDLHVNCAFLPEAVKRDDHPHSLSLIPSLPDYEEEDEEHVPACDACHGMVDIKNSWFYFCQDCDFGTHLDCVNVKVTPIEKTKEEFLAEALIELQVLELKQRLSKWNLDFSSEGANSTKRLGV